MAVEEHEIGKGTIAYGGEGAEYWALKSARFPQGRARITAALLLACALLTASLVSPARPHLVPTTVVSVGAADDDPSVTLLRLALPNGETVMVVSPPTVPAVGDTVTVTLTHDERVVVGSWLLVNLWVITLSLGVVGTWRAAHQYRRRHVRIRFR